MSDALNILAEAERQLRDVSAIELLDDGVRVTTHCMYPSNGLIRVMVRGGTTMIVASDDEEAVGEALAAGIHLNNPDRTLLSLIKAQGLEIHRGIIHTPRMDRNAIALGILLVANGARDAAMWLYDHHKLKRERDFRKLIREFLKTVFSDQVAPTKIVGKSNTTHTFSNVISFPSGKRLIVDPVVHDTTAINSRVVANLDIRNTMNPRIDQRIIYDDEENWSAAELNLLNVGAPVVPFSNAEEVIQRVARGLH